MLDSKNSAPPPDLRILPIDAISPHETHDSQRSEPLLEILREAEYLTNPPIVAPIGDGSYVVMDGANRYHCFRELGYRHLLVQVVDYKSEFVGLGVWNHIISDWDEDIFAQHLYEIPEATIKKAWDSNAVAQIMLKNGSVLSLDAPAATIEERNFTLRHLVSIYQANAKLSRTALHDPTLIWPQFPAAIALVIFPEYEPQDIIEAALNNAFLPPGVSRHIIHGRALKLYYPFEKLLDMSVSLDEKNAVLQDWIREKLANRGARYYAESTYQFDE
ncbi:MAG: hypothetical protein Q9P01_09715 [Anaerolineae bacterium]|nr:hypothetical protein [Anaerolineae bacterium]MDQ7035092.1 hypothetical protein [Anaerolineae bacterium]